MPTTSGTLAPRVAAYIAEHPGGPCGACGCSWELCTTSVLGWDGACCPACQTVDTHGTLVAQREQRRMKRQPRQVTVTTAALEDLARRLRTLDVPPHWRGELVEIAGELRSLASAPREGDEE